MTKVFSGSLTKLSQEEDGKRLRKGNRWQRNQLKGNRCSPKTTVAERARELELLFSGSLATFELETGRDRTRMR